jgi:hypothetical protein
MTDSLWHFFRQRRARLFWNLQQEKRCAGFAERNVTFGRACTAWKYAARR